MKKLILLLLFLALAVGADVAVKFYSEEPTNHQNRILGIPTNVVSEVIFNTNSAPIGYVLMSLEEYRIHQDMVRPAFRNWFTNVYEPWAFTNAQPTSQQISNRTAQVQALIDLMNSMQNAEDNWGTLTQAQIQGVVRAHNQFLIRLKPLLKDIYQQWIADK